MEVEHTEAVAYRGEASIGAQWASVGDSQISWLGDVGRPALEFMGSRSGTRATHPVAELVDGIDRPVATLMNETLGNYAAGAAELVDGIALSGATLMNETLGNYAAEQLELASRHAREHATRPVAELVDGIDRPVATLMNETLGNYAAGAAELVDGIALSGATLMNETLGNYAAEQLELASRHAREHATHPAHNLAAIQLTRNSPAPAPVAVEGRDSHTAKKVRMRSVAKAIIIVIAIVAVELIAAHYLGFYLVPLLP